MELNAVGRPVDKAQAVPGIGWARKKIHLDQAHGRYAQLHLIGICVGVNEIIRFRPLPANRGYTP